VPHSQASWTSEYASDRQFWETDLLVPKSAEENSKCCFWYRLQEAATYFALELFRSCSEKPLDSRSGSAS